MVAGEPPVILKLTYKHFFKRAIFLQLINKFKFIIKFSLYNIKISKVLQSRANFM